MLAQFDLQRPCVATALNAIDSLRSRASISQTEFEANATPTPTTILEKMWLRSCILQEMPQLPRPKAKVIPVIQPPTIAIPYEDTLNEFET
ncbi:hypothetical protein BELL_0633g00070 [Botrytis elliptica]|uniref:Uncharacterized protein n=1 Tax=Botrytis elliptica TaxID=278938 RepID=A0A4Z1JBF4_9HELO|nr:hypothetical protein BELL_0633g00070 [Botrytis elliptica]